MTNPVRQGNNNEFETDTDDENIRLAGRLSNVPALKKNNKTVQKWIKTKKNKVFVQFTIDLALSSHIFF